MFSDEPQDERFVQTFWYTEPIGYTEKVSPQYVFFDVLINKPLVQLFWFFVKNSCHNGYNDMSSLQYVFAGKLPH